MWVFLGKKYDSGIIITNRTINSLVQCRIFFLDFLDFLEDDVIVNALYIVVLFVLFLIHPPLSRSHT